MAASRETVYGADHPVAFVWDDSCDGVQFQRGGLCFLYHEVMDKGATMTVHLPLELVSLARDMRAEVKWCVPSSTGGYVVGVQYEEPLNWARYE